MTDATTHAMTSATDDEGRGLWVVKLGGSLALSPLLGDWLDALADQDAPLVVVSGGGPFADAVRETQAAMCFDDEAAHAMALMAMGQFAHAIASLHAGFEPADDPAAFERALSRGKIPVWRPYPLALRDPAIPQSWSVSSDSLAAWLAARLGARGLALIKSTAPEGRAASAEAMARRGVVDD